MKLWVTGLNHRTAPVSIRERLAFGPDDLGHALAQLKNQPGLTEGVIFPLVTAWKLRLRLMTLLTYRSV